MNKDGKFSAHKKIGKFEVRAIREEWNDLCVVVFSCGGTRLKTYEHDSIDEALITFNTVVDTLLDVSKIVSQDLGADSFQD